MNAKEEFEDLIKGRELICASIMYQEGVYVAEMTFNLKVGYSVDEYCQFLKDLDFGYDNGFGGQKLFGTVWLDNGVYAERGEYDGSEWWNLQIMPKIPSELLNN